jgi:hypothetical protein
MALPPPPERRRCGVMLAPTLPALVLSTVTVGDDDDDGHETPSGSDVSDVLVASGGVCTPPAPPPTSVIDVVDVVLRGDAMLLPTPSELRRRERSGELPTLSDDDAARSDRRSDAVSVPIADAPRTRCSWKMATIAANEGRSSALHARHRLLRSTRSGDALIASLLYVGCRRVLATAVATSSALNAG